MTNPVQFVKNSGQAVAYVLIVAVAAAGFWMQQHDESQARKRDAESRRILCQAILQVGGGAEIVTQGFVDLVLKNSPQGTAKEKADYARAKEIMLKFQADVNARLPDLDCAKVVLGQVGAS